MTKRKRSLAEDIASSSGGIGFASARLEQPPTVDRDSKASSDREDGLPRSSEARELKFIRVGDTAYPRSSYQGWQPPIPAVSEAQAVAELEAILREQHTQTSEKPEHDFIILDDFSAYRRPIEYRRPDELAGLETLQVQRATSDGLLFDCVLRVGETRRFVQGVWSKIITIEGYGDEETIDLSDRICVQSPLAKSRNIWYQLGRPSKEYRRFYDPFLWLAEFGKHFIDYLLEVESVTLNDFRFCFHDWLSARHESKPHFAHWRNECQLRDFRTTVAAHVTYLWNECWGVESTLLDHPIWGEVDPNQLSAIPEQPNVEQKTVVTPFAYEMFKHMYFHAQLQPRDMTDSHVRERNRKTKLKLGLTPYAHSSSRSTALLTPRSQSSSSPMANNHISAGDVVCLEPDVEGSWKSKADTWYAYVQAVRVNEPNDCTMLDILWLYEPHDTTLGAAHYPYPNELFLSDNCECGKDAIDASHVTAIVDISWYAKDPQAESGLFFRQKFRTIHDEGTYDFISLQPSDFQCGCRSQLSTFEECRAKYAIGDTVLVKDPFKRTREDRLDPAQVVDFDLQSGRVIMRRLERKHDTDPTSPSNQLILSDVTYARSPTSIIRKCHVGSFSTEVIANGLPTGYNRSGAGDFYFIDGTAQPAHVFRNSTNQGLLPLEEGIDLVAPPPFERLTGMGIFCGGGNFDRGLEESGAVKFTHAVDWAKRALHSYRANAQESDKLETFLGSVNDYLAQAMAGRHASYIALPGSIGLIAAGSPCPGFSALQQDKNSDDSLRNASLVASVVSYVDVLCPQYCVLENVLTMSSSMGGDENRLSSPWATKFNNS